MSLRRIWHSHRYNITENITEKITDSDFVISLNHGSFGFIFVNFVNNVTNGIIFVNFGRKMETLQHPDQARRGQLMRSFLTPLKDPALEPRSVHGEPISQRWLSIMLRTRNSLTLISSWLWSWWPWTVDLLDLQLEKSDNFVTNLFLNIISRIQAHSPGTFL